MPVAPVEQQLAGGGVGVQQVDEGVVAGERVPGDGKLRHARVGGREAVAEDRLHADHLASLLGEALERVRYTPHGEWHEGSEESPLDAYAALRQAPKRSNFERMRKDAEGFLPCLRDCEYEDSLWEVKTVLPVSELDDSRPILFVKGHGIRHLTCIMVSSSSTPGSRIL